MSASTTTTTTTTVNDLTDWKPLDPESLVAAPCLIEQTLCCPPPDENNNKEEDGYYAQPQFAKDVDYAKAVLDAWKEQEQDEQQEEQEEDSLMLWDTEWKSVQYFTNDDNKNDNNDNNKTPLYGHFVRRRRRQQQREAQPPQQQQDESSSSGDNFKKRNKIGIVLFHTGAGPHDLFLLWKATALVNTLLSSTNHNNDNVLVLIADIFSDDTGWAWDSNQNDRKQNVYQQLFQTTTNNNTTTTTSTIRPVLQHRIQAAFQAVQSEHQKTSSNSNDDDDDSNGNIQLAALGWCFGGHCILELSKMNMPHLKSMVTFHGVFGDGRGVDDDESNNTQRQQQQPISEEEKEDDATTTTSTTTTTTTTTTTAHRHHDHRCEILICNGCKDPFVSNESLEYALTTFQNQHHITSLLQLKNALHGFTNPAQDFNNNPAFGFDAESATKAWRQTISLLKKTLL